MFPRYRSQINLANIKKWDTRGFSKLQDTIYALSTGFISRSALAVIRISGPKAKYCLEALIDGQKLPLPRHASLRRLICPKTKFILDHSLVLWFPAPKSFTGEDVVEIHMHGSRAVVLGVFESLDYLDNSEQNNNIRPAQEGEFTKRAFDSGKMDLTEVEGLADLLASDTSEQRKQALRQMEGHLRVQFETWREELIKYLAHTEAVIDFGDDEREDDIDDSHMFTLIPKIKALRQVLYDHIKDGQAGELVRQGVRIVLVGPPNAGKSSLLNLLAKRPVAIVSPTPGTTRDVIEVRLDLGGVACLLSDTAGLRLSLDPLEQEGVRRARVALQDAQVKVFVLDAADPAAHEDAFCELKQLLDLERDVDDGRDAAPRSRFVLAMNKMDQLQDTDGEGSLACEREERRWQAAAAGLVSVRLSCQSGGGLDLLEAAVSAAVGQLLSGSGRPPLITRQRHRVHLRRCVEHLDSFLLTASNPQAAAMDLAAEDLRLAMCELGRLTGRMDVEEVLDVIFRDFCIGK